MLLLKLKRKKREERKLVYLFLKQRAYAVLWLSIILVFAMERREDLHLPSLCTCTSMYGTALEPVN